MSKLDFPPERRKEMSDIEKAVRPLSFAVREEIRRMRENPESKIDSELEKVRDSIEQRFSWPQIREELKRQILDEINTSPEGERKSLSELFFRVDEFLFGKILKVEESPSSLPELMAKEMVNTIIRMDGEVVVDVFASDLNTVATKIGVIGNNRLLGQFKHDLIKFVISLIEGKTLSEILKKKYIEKLEEVIKEWIPHS